MPAMPGPKMNSQMNVQMNGSQNETKTNSQMNVQMNASQNETVAFTNLLVFAHFEHIIARIHLSEMS